MLPALALLLPVLAQQQATPSSAPENPHLLLIGIDGLRPDALAAAETPHLDRLIAEGAYSAEAQAGPITVSGPGWTQVTSGVWGDRHGVTDNAFGGQRIDEFPDFFTFVEQQHPEYDTRALLSWKPLETFVVKGADRIEFQDYDKGGDAINVAKATEWMSDPSLDALYLYVADVDVAGHAHGFSPEVPEYIAEIEEVDAQLGQILDVMRARPEFEAERWLVVMTSDHGGIGTGHAGGEPLQRTVPYLVSGAGAHQGALVTVPNQVDTAVTCLWHLGIEIDPAWQLDGRAIGLKLELQLGEDLLFNGDAEHSPAARLPAADRGLPGWLDTGGMTVAPYCTDHAFNNSLEAYGWDRGENFFVAGPDAVGSRATQRIDIAPFASRDNGLGLSFDAGALLGYRGKGGASMNAWVHFLDAEGARLESQRLLPDPDAESATRVKPELSNLDECVASGPLPVGTRAVEVELHAPGPNPRKSLSCADALHFSIRRTSGFTTPGEPLPGNTRTSWIPGIDSPPEGPRPNLLLFMVDDLGWRDHSLDYGLGPDVPPTHFRTPNLERLAASGAVYTNAYAAAPVCTPSRVAWMTGQTPARSQVTYWVFDAERDTSAKHPTLTPPDWRIEGMQPSDPSLPRLLSDAGYRTIHVGKAHFGATGSEGENPLELGFDINIAGHGRGAPGSYLGTDHFQASRRQGKEGPGPWDVPGLEAYHGHDIFLTEALALEATREIRRAVAAGKPFFMNFAPYAVHTPIQANAKYLANYPNLDEREAAYATMVESVDTALGALLETLESEGVLDNTLIVYTSDNGGLSAHARGGEPNIHNAPLRSGKGSAYEGGVRVPLVVSGPGFVDPGTTSSDLVVSNDLFDTFLTSANVLLHAGISHPTDSLSLFSHRRRSTDIDRSTIRLGWHMPHQWGANGPGIEPFSSIRKDRYKLIHWHASGQLELYDLQADVGESENLADSHGEFARELAEELEWFLTDNAAQRSRLTEGLEPVPSAVESLQD